MYMTRKEFALGAVASVLASRGASGACTSMELEQWQREIDEVAPSDYYAYLASATPSRFPALKRLDAAFQSAADEARATTVERGVAIWLVYNMGLLVKTRETFFSVDLCHRLSPSIAGELDFALITHNHDDHYTTAFYQEMDARRHKTVVNNFDCNYGARSNPYHAGRPSEFGGGFTRGGKMFTFGDVEIRTSVSDHNSYLIGYTMPFEITVGNFTLFHSGDTSNVMQLNPTHRPDLWVVHPRNGLSVAEGVKKLRPRTTVIAHLNEFTHPKDKYRWTWAQGEEERQKVEAVGARAVVPVWGERLV